MMTEHTPTPWRLAQVSTPYETVVSADDQDVAECGSFDDAAFIVRCVNNHDALVSALLMSRAVHQDITENYEPSTTEHGMALSAIKTIDAALSRAEQS